MTARFPPAVGEGTPDDCGCPVLGALGFGRLANDCAKGQMNQQSAPHRVLNLPVAIATLVLVPVIVVAGIYFHGRQLRRISGIFLEQGKTLQEEAEAAESPDTAQQKYDEATTLLLRFIQLTDEPGLVAEARIRLAQISEELISYARSPAAYADRVSRAIDLHFRALGVAAPEDRKTLQDPLQEFLLDSRRFAEAESLAAEILTDPTRKDDPQANRTLALALYELTQQKGSSNGETAEALAKARQLQPGDVKLAVALAELYRSHPNWLSPKQKEQAPYTADQMVAASRIMGELVAAVTSPAAKRSSEDIATAFLARHLYRKRYKEDGAAADLEAALEKAPDNPRVLLVAADDAEARRDWEAAIGFYQRVLDNQPTRVEEEFTYQQLGAIYVELEQPEKAREVWEAGYRASITDADGNPRADQEGGSFTLQLRLASLAIAQGEDAAEHLAILDQLYQNLSGEIRVQVHRKSQLLKARFQLRKFEQEGDLRRLVAPGGAIELLEPLVASEGATAEEQTVVIEALKALGNCYGHLRRWDQAASVFNQLILKTPGDPETLIACARTLRSANRLAEAASRYERLVQVSGAPVAWLELAEVYLNLQAKLPKSKQSLNSFRHALKQAELGRADLENPWMLDILAAEAELLGVPQGTGQITLSAEARQKLQQAETQNQNNAQLFQTLVFAYERAEQRQDAVRALEKFKALSDDAEAVCMVEARLAVGREQYPQALSVLDAFFDSQAGPPPLAPRDLYAEICLAHPDRAVGLKHLQQLAARTPDQASYLFELALLANEVDTKQGEVYEQKLRELEGEEGTAWRYVQAQRKMKEASRTGVAGLLEDAERIVEQLLLRRPDWPLVHSLKGFIKDARGARNEAVQAYQNGIRLGDTRDVVWQRLLTLAQDDWNLTVELLQDSPSGSLDQFRINSAWRRGNFEEARRIAEASLREAPDDTARLVQVARVYMLEIPQGVNPETSDEFQQARNHLRRALQLDSSFTPALGSAFFLYLRAEDRERAKQFMTLLVDVQKDRAAKLSVQAQCHEALGELEKAGEYYRAAVAEQPTNSIFRMQLSRFIANQGESGEAIGQLRDYLKSHPGHVATIQSLVELLLMEGGKEHWDEAGQLLSQLKQSRDGSALTERLEAAMLISKKGRANLQQAGAILERLVALDGSANDRLLLAHLRELEGRPDDAQTQYLSVVERTPEPSYVNRLVDFLLRRKDLPQAQRWIEKLNEMAPRAPATALYNCRLLQGKGQREAIVPYMERWHKQFDLTGVQGQANHYLRVGSILADADEHQLATGWYRRAYELVPEHFPNYALSLSREGKVREGLELCQQATSRDPGTRPYLTMCVVLLNTPTDFDIAPLVGGSHGQVLKDAVNNFTKSERLLWNVANVFIKANQNPEAIALLQDALALNPRNVVTLNNLAMLMASAREDLDKALEYAQQALDIAGSQPTLLDTKATVLIEMKRSSEAIEVLHEALYDLRTDPRYLLHLAVAHLRQGQEQDARKRYQEALDHDLDSELLAEIDLRYRKELEVLQVQPTGESQ